MRFTCTRLRAAAFAAFTSVFIFAAAAPAPTEAAAPATATSAAVSPAQKVITKARTKLGRPWVHFAVGPNRFDCSGLVYYVFRTSGYARKIGGRMSARGYLAYFRKRGLASRTNPRPGDLVVWGGGSHVGIYIGGGRAISTLTSGVSIHRIHAVTARFTTYLHTGMSGLALVAPVVAAAPAAAPAPAAIPAPNPDIRPTGARAVGTRYATTRVNVRAGAGTWSRIVRVLPRNAQLTVVATGRDSRGRTWYRVQRAGASIGWVAAWLTRAAVVTS